MTDFADEARDIIRFMDEIYGLEYTDSDKSVAADHIQSALHEAYEAGVKDQILNTTIPGMGDKLVIAVEALEKVRELYQIQVEKCKEHYTQPYYANMKKDAESIDLVKGALWSCDDIARAALAKIQGGKT